MRGNAANLSITADIARGQTSFQLTWQEQGTRYTIQMGSTGNLTKDDLLRVAQSIYVVQYP